MTTTKTGLDALQVMAQHGGGTGVAFGWETQLLETPNPTTGTRA